MIGFSPSLWLDRKYKCPCCSLLVGRDDDKCGHCDHIFTERDREAMRSAFTRGFTVSAAIGFVSVTAIMLLVYLLAR